ncbi:MAG: polyprenyl synthetase family protein [Planctomycetales bacterium]|nr:polyprenyl synthetase family protein [Planctomycetales bacterium]
MVREDTIVAQHALLEHTSELTQRVETALSVELDRLAGACPERLLAAMRHSLMSGGKRLRPLLVLLAADACEGSLTEAMPAAVAVELVHTYSLIHDDLPAMDDDDMRRGRPACHIAFDEATAILAGDALLTLAFEVVGRSVKPAGRAAACCVVLAEAAGPLGMVAGQVDDLAAEGHAGTIEDLEAIHRRKTGALLTAALRLGAVSAGASDKQLAALVQFGAYLGLAFQIKDDLLDVAGDPTTLGKRTGQDEKVGKLTYPALLGVAASQQRIEELIHQARRSLQPLGQDGTWLAAVADYVKERDH